MTIFFVFFVSFDSAACCIIIERHNITSMFNKHVIQKICKAFEKSLCSKRFLLFDAIYICIYIYICIAFVGIQQQLSLLLIFRIIPYLFFLFLFFPLFFVRMMRDLIFFHDVSDIIIHMHNMYNRKNRQILFVFDMHTYKGQRATEQRLKRS